MRCIHCGNPLSAADAACRHCGARVVRPSVETPSGGGRSVSGLMAVAAALIGLGTAALIVWPARDAIVRSVNEYRTGPPAPPPPIAAATPEPTGAPAAPPIAAPVAPPAPTPAPAASESPTATAPAAPSPATRVRTAQADRRPATALPETAPPRQAAPPLPPPAARAAPATRPPTRVGGNIPAPRKVKDVPPVYPPMAIQARVQGVVIIEATIGPDGAVDNAKVLRSIPVLDDAALDAVRQWEYAPTFLNGVAVPVIMTVTVNFSLK